MSISIVIRFACLAATAVLLGGCPFGGSGNILPALKQLPAETQVLLAKSGMTQEAPILVRIFKEEAQLEVWKEKPDGRYYHFKTYPICTFSGELGPKIATGDKQSPEGFYTVTPGQMNPNSQFHLAFNLGFPNAYDKANGRTGSALMVHGDCRSAGCYAMTDALIEEIYALARESFRAGQTKFHVHAFPFRMTEANMQRHRDHKWYGFWRSLKAGYDDFELARVPPKVNVCSRQYLVNANFLGFEGAPDPAADCPAYRRAPVEPFNPFGGDGQIMARGPIGPETTQASRLAAYSPAPGQNQSAAMPQGQPAQQTQLAPAQQSAVSSQPATAARPAPSQPESRDSGPGTVSLAGAVATQPASASFDKPAPEPQSEKEKQEPGSAVTRGLHNVVQSGKSDMIMPNTQLR